MGFSFGLIMLGFVAAFPLLWWGAYMSRRAERYLKGEEPPKDRVKANLIVAVVVGFVAGGLAQSLWDNVSNCRAQGMPLFQCFGPQAVISAG